MFERHWGLHTAPLATEAAAFYRAAPCDEALARIHFLVEQRCQLGVLMGPWGLGKSTVLSAAARQLRSPMRSVVMLSGLACNQRQWLVELAQAWGLNPDPDLATDELWAAVRTRLVEFRYQRQTCVLLIDDLDDSAADLPGALARLLDLANAMHASMTVVLTTQPANLSKLSRRLLERADLRIELQPWTLADTEGFVEQVLSAAGRKSPTFAPQALEHLYDLASGNPRHVRQLLQLALAGAAGNRLPLVDLHTLDTVVAELGIPAPTPLPA